MEESEPPIRQPRLQVETRSPERTKLSEELAVLNRPLEDEVEYYDEAPRSRAKPVVAAMVVVAALGGAGYLLLAQRHSADDNAAAGSTRQGEASPIGSPPSASGSAAGAPDPEGDPPAPSARASGTPPRL